MSLLNKMLEFLFRYVSPEKAADVTVKYGIILLFGLVGAIVGYIISIFVKGDMVCIEIFMKCHSIWIGGALSGIWLGRFAVSQVSTRS